MKLPETVPTWRRNMTLGFGVAALAVAAILEGAGVPTAPGLLEASGGTYIGMEVIMTGLDVVIERVGQGDRSA